MIFINIALIIWSILAVVWITAIVTKDTHIPNWLCNIIDFFIKYFDTIIAITIIFGALGLIIR